MTAIVCVGLAVSDLIYSVSELPRGEGKTHARAFTLTGGGPAATAAVAVSRLGGTVRLIAPIGDDQIGDGIVSELTQENVDTSAMRRLRGLASPQSSIAVDDQGSRLILNYSDPDLFSESGVPTQQELESADAVLVDVRWPQGAVAALHAAKELGVPGIVDFDAGFTNAEALLSLASHIIFAEQALAKITGEADARSGLLAVGRRTEAFVGVTMGERGCLWLCDGETFGLGAFDVDVVDTTGAGDVFHGAFAWSLGEGNDESASMRIASAAAALSCGGSGGRAAIPGAHELRQFLEANE